ncbi:MAG TPA: hypothetical protein VGK94_13530 [Candidatus Polarisedimenticolia bacterium]|jgi:hypothetical protein
MRFEGSSWRTVPTPLGPDFEFITSDAYQNLDPKLWIDAAGNLRVALWREGSWRAASVYDAEAGAWPPPVLTSFPVW